MPRRSPRLQFSKEEQEAPELKKPIRKAEKAVERLEKAEAKIPKTKGKLRMVDADTGKVTTKLTFEEASKPPSKLSHAAAASPLQSVSAMAHREVHESEDENVGVESAHKVEETAENTLRVAESAHHSHKLKPYREAARAEVRADRANLQALYKEAAHTNPEFSSNPVSRWQQKRAIKNQYAAAKAGSNTTVTAATITKDAAKQAGETTKKAGTLIAKHKRSFLVVLGLAMIVLFLTNMVSSCSILVEGGISAIGITTYPSADVDMLSAEQRYCAMEAELRSYLDQYETTHDYHEYHYELDEIEHDPYVLISAITAIHGGEWSDSEIGGTLQTLFDKQYILTETVTSETRQKTETGTGERHAKDPDTGAYLYDQWGDPIMEEYEYDVEVDYTYYICHVKLENFDLSHVPVYVMSESQLSMYALYMHTLGNRPDLFGSSGYVDRYYNTEYPVYDIPTEALSDTKFAAMIKEAEKYLGYPYVWGGSSPSTSFDCSGFVCWVLNHSGWSLGRTTAEGLRQYCHAVSPANAKPGDLVFFQRTYGHNPGATHVGIYAGNNVMIHCGDPIRYTRINTSYWQEHFLSFGRLP